MINDIIDSKLIIWWCWWWKMVAAAVMSSWQLAHLVLAVTGLAEEQIPRDGWGCCSVWGRISERSDWHVLTATLNVWVFDKGHIRFLYVIWAYICSYHMSLYSPGGWRRWRRKAWPWWLPHWPCSCTGNLVELDRFVHRDSSLGLDSWDSDSIDFYVLTVLHLFGS